MEWLLCASNKGCCDRNKCSDPTEFFIQDHNLSKGSASRSASPRYSSGWSSHVQEMFQLSEPPKPEKSVMVVARPVLASQAVLKSPSFEYEDTLPPDRPLHSEHPAVLAASEADISSTGGTGSCGSWSIPKVVPAERQSPVACPHQPVSPVGKNRIVHRQICPWPTRFPERPKACILSRHVWDRLELLFTRMDTDSSGTVTREKAYDFFNAYSRVCTTGRFHEMDIRECLNDDGTITAASFIKFWTLLRESGCSDETILEEVDEILDGGKWIDWTDVIDIDTSNSTDFPNRPAFCRLSSGAWIKCAELWGAIAGSSDMITREHARKFFKGGFSNVSADTMFNEVDLRRKGLITPSEWMAFWVHVNAIGYSDKAIMEEVSLVLKGGTWLDWTSDLRSEQTEQTGQTEV